MLIMRTLSKVNSTFDYRVCHNIFTWFQNCKSITIPNTAERINLEIFTYHTFLKTELNYNLIPFIHNGISVNVCIVDMVQENSMF